MDILSFLLGGGVAWDEGAESGAVPPSATEEEAVALAAWLVSYREENKWVKIPKSQ